MSSHIHDYDSNVSPKLSAFQSAGSTGNTAGNSCDMLQGDGQCHAIQAIGTLNGNTPLIAGKIQESADGSTWTDISGAAFATAGTTSNVVEAITFQRTMRYLRYYSTISGTGNLTVPFSAVIGEQTKFLGSSA